MSKAKTNNNTKRIVDAAMTVLLLCLMAWLTRSRGKCCTNGSALTAGLKQKDKTRTVLACIFTCISGIGLWLFLRSGIPNYLFFRVPFAFLDYEKAGGLVFLENLLMLSFWGFIGTQTALICRKGVYKK